VGLAEDLVSGLFRSLFSGNAARRSFALLIIAFLVGLFVWDQVKRKRQLAAAAWQGITLHNEKNTLHLVERNGPKLPNVLQAMRTFESADEIYHYCYNQFEESAFEHLRIHRADGRETDFTRNGTQSDAENLARLQSLMTSDLPPSENAAAGTRENPGRIV
jgi:hypothetical protein